MTTAARLLTSGGAHGADLELIRRLFQAHFVLRLGLLLHSAVLGGLAMRQGGDPVGIVSIFLVMVSWTLLTGWWYLDRGRQWWMYLLDCLVTIAIVVAVHAFVTSGDGGSGIDFTTYWAAAAPMGVAICRGPIWGAGSALVIALAQTLAQPSADVNAWSIRALLVLASAGVGYMVDQVRRAVNERDEIQATAAALAERERIARIVHDGALQVLAMVEREGRSLGPRGQALAREAREQEGALRALLQTRPGEVDDIAPDAGNRELARMLDRHANSRVTISTMADEVWVPSDHAAEIDAVVSEVLSNVAKHAGDAAEAWVLLEREGREIILSIRDNGVGGTAAAFAGAADRGRLGVQESIYGRIRDLGGVAKLRTTPGRGVEWEFRIPVE